MYISKNIDIKSFLDKLVEKYNTPNFIENDPIFIPHRFKDKLDIESSAFLISLIAWGNRKAIIKAGLHLMHLMDNSPYKFIVDHSPKDLNRLKKFYYRTFKSDDAIFYIKAIKKIYHENCSIENLFYTKFCEKKNIFDTISSVRIHIFSTFPHEKRNEKHFPNPDKGSAAKRINLFLRWMVRSDNKGVDFGLWNKIKPAHLLIPLDIHAGNSARMLGLLNTKKNDKNAVLILTQKLKEYDENDPIKYDFALFGFGIENKWKNQNN